jgi:cell division septum initiation protein DivIVA
MSGDPGDLFEVSRRGYDRTEVDAFVADMERETTRQADLIAALEARVNQLSSELTQVGDTNDGNEAVQAQLLAARDETVKAKARILELESQVMEQRKDEEAIRLTLASATKTKDEMVEAAQTRLASATADAEVAAARIVDAAKAQAARIVDTAEQAAAERRDAAVAEAAEVRSDIERLSTERDHHLIRLKAQSDEMVAERDREMASRAAAFEADHAATSSKLVELHHLYAEMAQHMKTIASTAADDLTAGAGRLAAVVPAAPPAEVAAPAAPTAVAQTVTASSAAASSVAPPPAPSSFVKPNTRPPTVTPQVAPVEQEPAPVAQSTGNGTAAAAAAAAATATIAAADEVRSTAAAPDPFATVARPQLATADAETTESATAVEPAEPRLVAAEPEAEVAEPEAEVAEPETPRDEFWDPPASTTERGSFYSRRSGKLPRLGAEASRNAMTAALSMRHSVHNNDD